jgi:uroporphyrinogen-III synthase
VDATPVYRTVPAAEGLGPVRAPLLAGAVDWLLFTSSSTVTHFLALLDDAARAALARQPPRIACIGAVTAATAREGGLAVTVVPAQQDLDGLVRAVLDYVQAGGEHSPA